MSQLNLPDHPDLSHLRRQAKSLRDRVRRGDQQAIDQVSDHHPEARALVPLLGAEGTSPPFALADAQLTLSRAYGFPSWPALRRHVDEVHRLTRRPHLAPLGTGADRLLRLACLDYGSTTRGSSAEAAVLLAADPSLSRASLATAAATGDLLAAREILEADPSAVHREDGPFGWTPLLYLTYSRLGGAPGPLTERQIDHLGVARLLLAAGADPNAGFLWDGLTSPFTALTGAFGGGEQGAPPHPQELELARLLLEAGASANDSQTIYNRGAGDAHARDDTEYLELLLQAGLGRGDGGPWHRLLAPRHPAPRQLLAEALQHAAHAGLPRRVRLLLDHGADPDLRSTHPVYFGRSPYEEAVLQGNPGVSDLLERAGAATSSVGDPERVVGELLAPAGSDGTSTRSDGGPAGGSAGRSAGSGADAALLDVVRQRHPDLVARAAAAGRADAIERCLGHGFGIDARTPAGLTALHEAAVRGDTGIVTLLFSRGADPELRDPQHGATPGGWAAHGGHDELAALLHSAAEDG
ncbi:ankyrin repeat domain-containing protein [Brachybacterium tyrofermentans]|uniref:ankyrin repeat domain-containing protein n=1 Tax=Brachybacterium tyrofermentans TaxID=47848 RepID=UPI003FD1E739